MKKEELIKNVEKKGWKMETDHQRSLYRLNVWNIRTTILVRGFETHYGYKMMISGEGEEKIDPQVFQTILTFLHEEQKEKAIIFGVARNASNEKWKNVIKKELENQEYQQIDFKNKEMNKILSKDKYVSFYITKNDQKEIDRYISYHMEINHILQTNHHEKVLFDYNSDMFKGSSGLTLFMNISYDASLLELIMDKQKIKVRILAPGFYRTGKVIKEKEIENKKEIKSFLQEFIDQKEQTQRVRTLFETNTYFFERYCNINKIFDFPCSNEELYNALLVHYDAKQIEYIAAKMYKDKEKKQRFVNRFEMLCHFDDKGIVIKKRTGNIKILSKEQVTDYIKRVEKNIS